MAGGYGGTWGAARRNLAPEDVRVAAPSIGDAGTEMGPELHGAGNVDFTGIRHTAHSARRFQPAALAEALGPGSFSGSLRVHPGVGVDAGPCAGQAGALQSVQTFTISVSSLQRWIDTSHGLSTGTAPAGLGQWRERLPGEGDSCVPTEVRARGGALSTLGNSAQKSPLSLFSSRNQVARHRCSVIKPKARLHKDAR